MNGVRGPAWKRDYLPVSFDLGCVSIMRLGCHSLQICSFPKRQRRPVGGVGAGALLRAVNPAAPFTAHSVLTECVVRSDSLLGAVAWLRVHGALSCRDNRSGNSVSARKNFPNVQPIKGHVA